MNFFISKAMELFFIYCGEKSTEKETRFKLFVMISVWIMFECIASDPHMAAVLPLPYHV